MIERIELKNVISRIEEPRRFIQVLAGPRQVGKTTLVLQALDQVAIPHKYESADGVSAGNAVWISQIWEEVRIRMKISTQKEFLLVIDEVQKITNWSETIKKEWDADTRMGLNIKLILLGSSRLLIQQGLTESLAGRFEIIHLSHWTYSEMQSAFGWNLQQYIYFGGYPGSAPLIGDETRWKEYIRNALVETSISKDILMLTRVDKPALLRNLFELGARFSGQILSYTKMLGQLLDAGNTTTLAHYLKLLNDSGLLGGLEKYSGSAVNKRASSPKFQVYNNALLSLQLDTTFEKAQKEHDLWGRLFESTVGSHLLNNAIKSDYQLLYWHAGNYEIDFLMKKKEQMIGLEVKSGVCSENLGMSLFKGQYPDAKLLLVGTNGTPLDEFLKINPIELF
ncbi:MAG: AAA family ATPase [Candidatus Symbiothrix sp.]|jgi:predicted AAA+ superfamily ATPase|nr:AAA family ATPase [Candidatus Symbiothrix sp.]